MDMPSQRDRFPHPRLRWATATILKSSATDDNRVAFPVMPTDIARSFRALLSTTARRCLCGGHCGLPPKPEDLS